ncbi:MAG: MerR family transcriptional regulator [Oscillospiraceae bacterium]|nr:MerR family transcriptional regulator [Oscillospiraceae bacterium]
MTENGLFSISEFAKYARTTRDTLLHYDRIDLLPPVSRRENNYRYYSANQLLSVSVIRSLQQLGMSLEEIRELKNNRTPELSEEVLAQQIVEIDAKIDEWNRARKLLHTLRKMIRSVKNIDDSKVVICQLPAEAIILGDLNDYSGERMFYDAFLDFYQKMSSENESLDLNYPVWAIHSEDNIRQGIFYEPDRFFFYNPDGCDKKPASLYAVCYKRCGYGDTRDLYDKFISYIDDNGYEICGYIYEEYPLNETCVGDFDNYVLRVMAPIRKKT